MRAIDFEHLQILVYNNLVWIHNATFKLKWFSLFRLWIIHQSQGSPFLTLCYHFALVCLRIPFRLPGSDRESAVVESGFVETNGAVLSNRVFVVYILKKGSNTKKKERYNDFLTRSFNYWIHIHLSSIEQFTSFENYRCFYFIIRTIIPHMSRK